MGESGAGVRFHELLDLLPIAFIVAYFFARAANGQHAAEDLHFIQGGLKLVGAFPDPLFEISRESAKLAGNTTMLLLAG